MQAGRLDQSQAASRADQKVWTRLQDKAHGPGRVSGSRLQAERSELIWQQGGPSCRQRRQEAGELAGGREAWKFGEWEAERPSHRQEGQVWVGGWEGRKAQLQAGISAAGLEAKRPRLQAGRTKARGAGRGVQRPEVQAGGCRQGCRPCPWC